MPVLRPRRIAALLLAPVLLASCATAEAEGSRAARDVRIGVIDTGIAPGALDDVIDRSSSRSFVAGEGLDDRDGHGTEMAWILHAAAPEATLLVAKVVDDDGATTDERVAAAIDHLRRHGATVVLVSLAGAEPLPRIRDAIEAAGRDGVRVVAAAGNDGVDLDRQPSYPGGYDLPNLVTVAAAGRDGHLLGSSNRGGPTSATALGAVETCSLDGRPVTATGTSAAAALVAGTLASAPHPSPPRSVLRARPPRCPSNP